jgi:hypothetical protein
LIAIADDLVSPESCPSPNHEPKQGDADDFDF